MKTTKDKQKTNARGYKKWEYLTYIKTTQK